ncbi:MAG: hypothetical protein BroJett018_02760 [Chloroflexota bacterium]|nr:hypothetical protein [Chloroflexota bacterium]NOG61930.1 AAA family ATPase [Chloroflexota bacterium]GIK62482.1 MAG: hypothetical protein BroJett018_02760 [Chloroflexota bacterium]
MTEQGITALGATNFKSLRDESRIEIRPLTILAGANSSGKSSIIQPLLLLKQTLEATYDPGALLINGPNVRFTGVRQLIWKSGRSNFGNIEFWIELEQNKNISNLFRFPKNVQRREIELIETIYEEVNPDNPDKPRFMPLKPDLTSDEISQQPISYVINADMFYRRRGFENILSWHVAQERCFFKLELVNDKGDKIFTISPMPETPLEECIRLVIHVPGLRGNPERTYKTTAATGPMFPGTFEPYVASIISRWQIDQDNRLDKLGSLLEILGLTNRVSAKRIDDTQVELQVGRLPLGAKGGPRDMVSIADVGFGVSQVLPVLVALLAAEPGQLVYLEQPEIHLHPRAQVALAQVLADAANRGVRVVAETHSDLLLLGVQTLVAEGKLAPEKVKLHWFSRGDDGATTISSRDLDETGSYGDWPEDFGETTLTAQSHFMDAAEAHQPEN